MTATDWLALLATVAAAYVVGASPFGYLAGRMRGIDIRDHGSGNIGATNVLRTLGKSVGIPVFILDVVKGVVPVVLARAAAARLELSAPATDLMPVVAALGAILGHNFTFWLGFRGGKGVATSAGALLALMPVAVAAAVLVWLVVFFSTRFVALASITAALAVPAVVVAEAAVRGAWKPALLVFSLVVAILAVVRHRSNIKRLLAGTEHRFERRRQADSPGTGDRPAQRDPEP